MLSWFGGVAGDPVAVSVTNPANASQSVTIEVDRGLLNAGEQGILVVSIACDLTSLFAPQDASGLIADLPVNPLNGQAFIEVSVLVSSDGGATFDEIEDLMLNGESAMRMTYTAPGINGSAKFRSHPTFVDSGAGGIQVLPTAGAWTDTGVDAQDATGDTLTADLAALSVFGIFPDQTLPSELTVVSPDVSQPLDFGVLEPGDTSMIDLEITNSGDGVIMGMPQITAGGNAFSLVGASGYTIGAGVTRTITVRFLPNAEGMFDGTLELTGGDNGTVVIDLIGTGDRKVNSNFGCGGGAEAGGGFGDVLVLSLVLGALALATRRARRQQ
jgi:hypothetical protein